MIQTTKANDYHNINESATNMSGDATLLIDKKILQDLESECEKITCEKIKVLNNIEELVQQEEEEEDVCDGDNCTSPDEADNNDDDDDDEDDEERDLTNLTWLTELRNQTMSFVNMALDEDTKRDNEFTAVATEQISTEPTSHVSQLSKNETLLESNSHQLGHKNQKIIFQNPQHNKSDYARTPKILNQPKRPSPAERYEMFLSKIKRDLEIYEESALTYESDVVEKPPFNYSHIIGMAMLENGRRVTLQQICSWIERKFAFFRVRKKWNNSIRHNLSLHPCFRKIGRSKEDKGKGGYWELGVDPKKCDRKRIRNRKSTAQPAKMQKKHLQAHFIKTSKRRQQNIASIKKFNFKQCNGIFRNFTTEQEYEELLLDEMDVQHNIDVMSTNANNNNSSSTNTDICYKYSADTHAIMEQIDETTTHNSQNAIREREELMLTNFMNNNDDDDDHGCLQQNDNLEVFNNKICPLADGDICYGSEQSSDQTCHQQQYKLGTIIISSANVSTDMPNIQHINQRTINSFLTSNPTKQLLTEEQQSTNSIHYSEVEDVPQNDNVIISSYISDLSDGFSSCTQESKSNQCHHFTSSNTSNSITLDFSAFPTQSLQRKPNVIVEQLIQQPSLSYSATEIPSDCMPTSSSPASFNSSTATMCAIGAQRTDYANELVSEHFRPYIDGIDEAFQYLRSIDSTRNEDILDNLLDISVSDY